MLEKGNQSGAATDAKCMSYSARNINILKMNRCSTHKSVKEVSLANATGKSPVNEFDDKTLKMWNQSRPVIRIILMEAESKFQEVVKSRVSAVIFTVSVN